MHGKPFPNNLIDTDKTEMAKIYVERQEEIEGQKVTLALFVSAKSENAGIDLCASDLQEKILNLLSDNGITPVWKVEKWNQETMQKKDGSGSYTKNVKSLYSPDEYRQKLIEEKKKVAPTINK